MVSQPASGDGSPPGLTNRLGWAGALLGFALGGFFDGILLHQVLQWHHLLSGLDGQAFQDIRTQILADGLFHGLMYVVAAVGLWLLWRARREWPEAGGDRLLAGNALLGFGGWHVLDAVLSHWILGIHRIRMGADDPLLWDLLWLVVFGVGFLAAGWAVRRRRGGTGGGGRRAATVALVLAVMVGGPVAALPPAGATTVVVLFAEGTSDADALAAMRTVGGRLVWKEPSGALWAFDLGPGGNGAELYRHGALLVSSALLPAGCFGWSSV